MGRYREIAKHAVRECEEQLKTYEELAWKAKEYDKLVKEEGKQANEQYLSELGRAENITLLQFQKLLHPMVDVVIKPNNHKTYWTGSALYIPKEMYGATVKDVSLRKKGQQEFSEHGTICFFVEQNEMYEKIADEKELEEINRYYREMGC